MSLPSEAYYICIGFAPADCGSWGLFRVYPHAKILYPGKEDFTPDRRVEIFNQMKNNDWDAIILSHEQFGMIPQSPEIQRDILQQELDSVEENARKSAR